MQTWHIWQKWKVAHSDNYFDTMKQGPICRSVLSYFDARQDFHSFLTVPDFHRFSHLIRLLGGISEDEPVQWFHFVWQKNLQRILLKAARNSLEMK